MLNRLPLLSTLAGAAAITAMLVVAPAVQAQKIVCWKDKAGKVVGCGDRIPPEYQQNESKTLDRRGITRETSVSAEEAARLREDEKKNAAAKAEENQRLAEQRRQDTALINTYTSAKEIDLRRDRELQVVDLQIQQLKAALKRASDAHDYQKKRLATIEKNSKPTDLQKDDLSRAADEQTRLEASIADREKDKERLSASYAQQKSRYLELKGGSAASSASNDAKSAPKK